MSEELRPEGANGGFGALQIRRASTAEQVAEPLREMILRGELEQGQPLREMALASSIGVSRNTVREAIRVLAREGIVTLQMHHGAVVTRLSVDDVEDIFRVRRVLELTAVQATDQATADQLSGLKDPVRALEAAVETQDWAGIIDADQEFHRRLVEVLGSRRLNRFFDGIQAEVRLCMSIVDRSYTEPSALIAEHQELLQLIVDRKPGRVTQLMEEHLTEAEETLKALVADRAD